MKNNGNGNETNLEYARRAADETTRWLEDRGGNCHPLMFAKLDLVRAALAGHVTHGAGTRLAVDGCPRHVRAVLLGMVMALIEKRADQ